VTCFKASLTELTLQPKCEPLILGLVEVMVSLHDLFIKGAEAGTVSGNAPVIEGFRFSQQGGKLG
jgi:hypothetical protein